jgi:REP element-mobilizing transposase RayT
MLPSGDADFSTRWHEIKARFAAQIPRGERLSARRLQKGERGIWPRRFWEHVIRDERDYERQVDYIHYNPVKQWSGCQGGGLAVFQLSSLGETRHLSPGMGSR